MQISRHYILKVMTQRCSDVHFDFYSCILQCSAIIQIEALNNLVILQFCDI